jgi:hypothetical protein
MRDVQENPDANSTYLTEARQYLKNFQEKPQYYIHASKSADAFIHAPVARRNHFKFLLNLNSFFSSFTWLIRSHVAYLTDAGRFDYTTIKPWYEALDKLTRKVRVLRGYRDLYEKPNHEEEYAFFALQNEPEGLPMLLSPFYSGDQIWVIKQLARSLPLHFKLYVKDHPVMINLRTRAYYKELKKIPNVKVIDPAYSGLTLTQNAKLVVTITSTAGMEAAFLKKPAIIFSPVFYNALPNVVQCKTIEELPMLVENALKSPNFDEKKAVEFIAAIYKESIPLDLTHIWHVEGGKLKDDGKKALTSLADLMDQKIRAGNPAH